LETRNRSCYKSQNNRKSWGNRI